MRPDGLASKFDFSVVPGRTFTHCWEQPHPRMAENEITEKPLTTGEWFLTLLILGLPLIGLIMHLVWAFGDGHRSRRNFCRASLLLIAVLVGLAFIGFVSFLILGGTLATLLSQGGHR